MVDVSNERYVVPSPSPPLIPPRSQVAVLTDMRYVLGQGPYWGQAVWFSRYHPGDKIPSAIERYTKEIRRVLGVIDLELRRGNKEWLVGGKCSYADLSFVPWNLYTETYFEGTAVDGWREELPYAAAWHSRLMERPAVKVNKERREAAIAAGAPAK